MMAYSKENVGESGGPNGTGSRAGGGLKRAPMMGVCTEEMSPHSSKHELAPMMNGGGTVGGSTSSTTGGFRKRF